MVAVSMGTETLAVLRRTSAVDLERRLQTLYPTSRAFADAIYTYQNGYAVARSLETPPKPANCSGVDTIAARYWSTLARRAALSLPALLRVF